MIRWIILGLIFLATGLNFLDRQVLSITIIKIQKEFDLSDMQYGMVNTSFLISYALMFTISGRLIDRWGAKVGLACSVLVWSIASGLHGLMNTFTQLLLVRFLLGVGEGGCFPGAAKAVNELFAKDQRAFANGIAIAGSAIGAVLAPPLTIWLANAYGWRWSFIVPGLIGVVWFFAWISISWKRHRQPREVDQTTMATNRQLPFVKILADRRAQVFIAMRFLVDPVFYFIMFWIPKYLNEYRNVSFDEIGKLLWIPFLALGVSNMLGGWLSDQLIRRKYSVNMARKSIMGIAAALTLSAMAIQVVSSVGLAIGLMTLLLFAHGFWVTNYITVIADIFGDKATSTVVGLSGTAGATAGILVNPLIGWVVGAYTYTPLWIACGLVYPLAFLLFIVLIPVIKPAARIGRQMM